MVRHWAEVGSFTPVAIVVQILHMNKNILEEFPQAWGPSYLLVRGALVHASIHPNEHRSTASSHYFMNFLTPVPQRALALNSDRAEFGFTRAGCLEIIPQGSDYSSQWGAYKECVFIAVPDEHLRSLAWKEELDEAVEFAAPGIGHVDEYANQISRSMLREAQSTDLGHGECLDALCTLYLVHMLRRYTSRAHDGAGRPTGGLPQRKWKMINDYIQANLAQRLTLESMAELVHLSPSHFARAFRQTTGLPPHQYVLQMRLMAARNLMQSTRSSLGEVARLAGFANHSHMSASIRKAWGLTPSQARKRLRAG